MDNNTSQQVEPQPSVNESPITPEKQPIKAIIIIVVILAFGIGYYFLSNKAKNPPPVNPTPTVSQAPVAESTTIRSTLISFEPPSNLKEPITVKSGESFDLDVMINPGYNAVTFTRLIILYDPSKVKPIEKDAFKSSPAMSNIIEGPIYASGKISVIVTVGPDPTKAIIQKANVGSITFEALGKTASGSPTIVSYSSETSALSVATQDNASDNVISGTVPASIAIVE